MWEGREVTVALYAGSFDPVHLGHMSVIEHVAGAYDGVVVAVVANPDKPTGLLDPSTRLRLITDATSHLPSVRSVQFFGLTVDLARREGAGVLIRSAHKERGNEVSMVAMNRTVAEIPTVFVPVDVRFRGISSSLVRSLLAEGHLSDAKALVPDAVHASLTAAASERHVGNTPGS